MMILRKRKMKRCRKRRKKLQNQLKKARERLRDQFLKVEPAARLLKEIPLNVSNSNHKLDHIFAFNSENSVYFTLSIILV
jgi:hypothetical protein